MSEFQVPNGGLNKNQAPPSLNDLLNSSEMAAEKAEAVYPSSDLPSCPSAGEEAPPSISFGGNANNNNNSCTANTGGMATTAPLLIHNPEVEYKDSGVLTHDPVLNSDPNALLNFFIQNCQSAPRLEIRVEGTHTERRRKHDSNEYEYHTVHDFKLSFDASNVIQPFGVMYAVPDSNGRFKTVPEILAAYTANTSSLKGLHLRKVPLWNFNRIEMGIKGAIRRFGYRSKITVEFIMHQHKVKIESSSTISRFAHDDCVRCLCFVSCLCILVLPFYLAARDKEDNTLRADYRMSITEDQWMYQNYWRIVEGSIMRWKDY